MTGHMPSIGTKDNWRGGGMSGEYGGWSSTSQSGSAQLTSPVAIRYKTLFRLCLPSSIEPMSAFHTEQNFLAFESIPMIFSKERLLVCCVTLNVDVNSSFLHSILIVEIKRRMNISNYIFKSRKMRSHIPRFPPELYDEEKEIWYTISFLESDSNLSNDDIDVNSI
ncbi:hypothetical protein TNCV_1850011 [Trichonephila clavipes]|nr:hypothetical protein TNCV_1850011 [Trichonephila clavipes]